MGPEVERTEFSYDSDNNMIGAEVNGTNWTFRYNTQNQMYYSKITFGASVIDERFYIYDGLDCIAETAANGNILREYIRIGNVGGIVAEIRHNDPTCAPGFQSGTFYYHYNHRGDVIAVSASDGNLIFKADYDAYGKQFTANSLPLTDFKPRYTFSTKRYFKDLGLYYYGYRWYLLELGRWTTKDRIGYKGGTYNLYMFCANTVLTIIDKYGLSGTITIYSSRANYKTWFGFTYGQHSWIEYKRDGSDITFVLDTTPDGFDVQNKNYLEEKFIWNEENDSKRSMHINDEQEKRLLDHTSEYDCDTGDWNHAQVCSDAAADMWEAATGEDLEDRHLNGLGYSDPNVLADSIDVANKNNPCP